MSDGPTRRSLLRGLSAVLLAPGCEPDPEPAAPSLPTSGRVLSGDATASGVRLAVRTEAVGPLSLRVSALGTDASWTEVVRTDGFVPENGVAQATVAGLDPDREHRFVFIGAANQSPVGRFRTAPAAGSSRIIRFGATSCLGHRDCGSLAFAALEDLDFFVLLGDTIYPGGGDTVDYYRPWWDAALSRDSFTALAASTSFVPSWDDHEVFENWSRATVSDERYQAALTAFREALPQSGGPTGGVWRLLGWGDALDLIVLDVRSERDATRTMSDEQLTWLKECLLRPSRFKVVVTSIPITDIGAHADTAPQLKPADRWTAYPAQREEILAFLADNGIEGVVFLAGDWHWGMIGFVDPPGNLGEDRVEVLCGPAGSLPITPDIAQSDPQFPVVFSQWNTVVFEADPDAGTLRIRFIGDDGEELVERLITP